MYVVAKSRNRDLDLYLESNLVCDDCEHAADHEFNLCFTLDDSADEP